MGSKHSKTALPAKELASLREGTKFSDDEINMLFAKFCQLKGDVAAKDIASATLSVEEFQKGTGYGSSGGSLFVERVFRVVFDSESGGKVTFKDFVQGVHRLSAHGKKEERVRIAFGINDVSGSGKISRADLAHLLRACFKENGVAVSDAAVEAMVNKTFEEHDEDGDDHISLEEYTHMVRTSPRHLDPITLNVATLLGASEEGGGEGSA